MNDSHYNLTQILEKATQGGCLERDEIVFLLGLTQKKHIDDVFSVARELRSRHFGNRVFLYGFIYISTFCRNNCNFCYYRSANVLPERYRRKASDIILAAQGLAESGVHLIDLTLGEDPLYFQDQGFESFFQLVKMVRQTTCLPVMVSPGVVPADVLAGLSEVGVSWYACYQETHNRELFIRLRPGQSYAARMKNKELAGQLGLLTEEGLLCGVGESAQDVADSIRAMRLLKVSQMRAMSFVPQKGTPMQSWENLDPLREMLMIAILRLAFPDRLIPATLDVAGLAGLHSRLEAGANVVTSLVPPGFGLAGVAQSSLDIADARRTPASIRLELEKVGMQSASAADYSSWVENRRRQIRQGLSMEKVACRAFVRIRSRQQ
jgi:methylornithine synthase